MSSELHDLTAVIYSRKDALSFKHLPHVTRLLPLTPDARANLGKARLPVISSMGQYGEYAKRRTVARVRKEARFMMAAVKNDQKLGDAAKEVMLAGFHIAAECSIRLWYTIKDVGPWLVPDGNKWTETADLDRAHTLVLRHIEAAGNPILRRGNAPIFAIRRWGFMYNFIASVFRLYNHLMLRITHRVFVARRGENSVLVFFNGFGYGAGNLANRIADAERNAYVAGMSVFDATPRSFLRPFKTLANVWLRRRTFSLCVASCRRRDTIERVTQFIDRVRDPVIRKGLRIFNDMVIETTAYEEGLVLECERLLNLYSPRRVILNMCKWCGAPALSEAGRTAGITRTLISHGTHTAQVHAIAAHQNEAMARGVFVSPLVDETLAQSPHALRAAESFSIQNKTRCFRPIMWGYRNADIAVRQNGHRTILHTGTYKPWQATKCWMFETSDEFVEGLIPLIRAVGDIPRTRLIIRVRTLPECELSSLQALLPEGDHYQFKSGGTFLDDLKSADLLVSLSSTTIEEALHAGTPVLLWGGFNKYKHLPGQRTPPTPGNRNLVYTVDAFRDLRVMITSILDVHSRRGTDDDELTRPHVWPKDTPGIDEFITDILA